MFEQVNVNCYCCQLLLFDSIWWLWLYLFWTERWMKFSDWLVYWVVKETRIRKKENQGFKVRLKSSDSTNFASNAWTGKCKMLISSVAAFWEDRVAMAEEEVAVIISLLIWLWTGHQKILISSYNVKGCNWKLPIIMLLSLRIAFGSARWLLDKENATFIDTLHYYFYFSCSKLLECSERLWGV